MNKIIDIIWIRSNLILKLDKKISNNDKIYLIQKKDKIKINFTKDDEIYISLTNCKEGNFLERGLFKIIINDVQLKISSNILKTLDDKSRIFKYNVGRNVCCVTYNIDQEMNFMFEIEFIH